MNALPKVGDRVRFTASVDNYPTVVVGAGATGTVTTVAPEEDAGWVGVTLDARIPDLDEWENEVHVYADRSYGDDAADDLAATFAKCAEAITGEPK